MSKISFINIIKEEIISKIKKSLNKNNCLSFLYALFKTISQINLNTNSIQFITNNEKLFPLINASMNVLNFYEAELEIEDEVNFKQDLKYNISLSKKASSFLLKEFVFNSDDFNKDFLNDYENRIMFLKTLFVCSGTGNLTINSENNGYLIEYVFNDNDFSLFVLEMLSEFDIFAKKVERRGQFVIYLNKFETISDILALFGATNSVLSLNNESILREVRNNINRQNNCMEANINKTIQASIKQIEAINFIDKTIGISSLNEDLQEVCLLRLANKEENLDNLVKLLNNKITKSGLNHRLNKIIKISEELKDKL